MRSRRILLLTGFLACALVANGFGAATAHAAPSDAERTEWRRINNDRRAVGRRLLSLDADLSAIARRHSREMAANKRIYHNSRLRYQARGYRYLGENVGAGRTVVEVHRAFMGSKPHRANILGKNYRRAGVGIVSSGGFVWITHVFYG